MGTIPQPHSTKHGDSFFLFTHNGTAVILTILMRACRDDRRRGKAASPAAKCRNADQQMRRCPRRVSARPTLEQHMIKAHCAVDKMQSNHYPCSLRRRRTRKTSKRTRAAFSRRYKMSGDIGYMVPLATSPHVAQPNAARPATGVLGITESADGAT